MGLLMERITDAIAALAVGTWVIPDAYEWLASFSTLASLLLPPLGCVWLAVQIWSRIFKGK